MDVLAAVVNDMENGVSLFDVLALVLALRLQDDRLDDEDDDVLVIGG